MNQIVTNISKLNDKDILKYFENEDITILHSLKLYLDDIYYNTGLETGLTDWQYDLLKEIISKRNSDFILPIGAKIRYDDNSVKLPYWLGSMNKLKPDDKNELKRWLEKYKNETYIIEDKLDGISCLLILDDNKIKLYTRGDGITGSDISYLSKYIKNIPKEIYKNDIVVRGELIIKKQIFESKYANEFANPRNFVSGRIGSKTLRKGVDDIEFIAYEVIDTGINIKPEMQLELLKELGFKVVNYNILNEITKDILLEQFLINKQNSEYEIDGIIVQSNVPYKRNTSGNPSYVFAFKVRLDSNLVEAEVEEVEWNISKWGIIKPRIRIKPVNLNGVKITYATAFNAKYIVDNNIGPGTIIKLTRSGDVIPFIVDIIKSTKASLPEIDYEWNETKIDIFTTENKDIMCIKLVSSFFAALKIKHVSEATVRKMYEYGFDTVLKIIEADKNDFEKIEGFGKRLAERTYDNIHEGLKNIHLSTLLGASGVFGMGIGIKKIDLLIKTIPNILDIFEKISEDDLFKMINEIEGYSDKTTNKIIENLPWAKKFVYNLKQYVTFKQIKIISSNLNGLKIVFTGFRDKNLEDEIIKRGGKITTSVSKNTSIVIVDDKNTHSTKVQKALELKLTILEKDEFIQIYDI